jgi:hypothetical protein
LAIAGPPSAFNQAESKLGFPIKQMAEDRAAIIKKGASEGPKLLSATRNSVSLGAALAILLFIRLVSLRRSLPVWVYIPLLGLPGLPAVVALLPTLPASVLPTLTLIFFFIA